MLFLKLSLITAVAFNLFLAAPAGADESMENYIHPTANEVCADGPSDLASMSPVRETVKSFGGLDGIEGAWRLSGLAGVIAKVRVTIGYTANYFYVRTDNDAPKSLQLCFSPDTAGILRLRIPNASDKQIALIFVKPGNVGQSIYVAAEKSNWKFYKFKRVN